MSESIPGILVTCWVIFTIVLIVVRRQEVIQRKPRWLVSIWIFPGFAVAQLLCASLGSLNRYGRLVLTCISFLVNFAVWIALITFSGGAAISQPGIAGESALILALIFAPGFVALLVWITTKKRCVNARGVE